MKAPQAPDPAQTAAAQAQMNKDTAVAQYGLGATNQITPQGNLTYEQIGTWSDGTPRFQATTSYSPEQKELYDKYTGLAGQLGDIGNNQAAAVSDTLSQPFKLGNEATESRLMELGRTRLDPVFGQRRDALETKLRNQGIQPGSEAWTRAVGDFDRQENDAYNSLLLSGRAQAANESLTERNQPLTELMALLSGTQPTSPQFQSTPQPGVAGVDYAGLVQDQYKSQLANYQAKLGGLFGLGSAALGGLSLGGWGGLSSGARSLKGAGLF